MNGASRQGPPTPAPSLFWRLFPSYLLVVAVGAVTAFVAGEAFAPFFLERHMGAMMGGMHGPQGGPMTEGMASDLEGAYRRALTSSLAWATAGSVVAAALVGLFVTGRIVAPLRAMTRASRRIAGGTYQDRLTAGMPGEIGELVGAFNKMAATLESTEAQRVALLADVAHEFRTPLSNLKGYVEGLEDGVFAADEATLAACRRQVDRLGRLVDDLSVLSRVETGQLELRPAAVAAGDLLEHAREAFQARFERKGVRLDVDAPPSPLVAWTDAERTGQMLANLTSNALRHTPHGGRVRLRATREDARSVRFEVEDSGAGISDEDLPHLFTRFYRGDKARARDGGEGSGIGLTLVKELAQRQGGEVGVRSTPGEGSTFWFTLPLAAPPGRA
ncbi:MAG: HAMP domain-containing sensor histidine kinase [Trueperaceae bacterium]|nr:HAMP domain-containing sensor histidine kinase [Trueperaceae bacterium]